MTVDQRADLRFVIGLPTPSTLPDLPPTADDEGFRTGTVTGHLQRGNDFVGIVVSTEREVFEDECSRPLAPEELDKRRPPVARCLRQRNDRNGRRDNKVVGQPAS